MRSPVHAPGITLGRSRAALRTDKKRNSLALKSHPPSPDVAGKTSPQFDVRSQPTGEAAENGNLIN